LRITKIWLSIFNKRPKPRNLLLWTFCFVFLSLTANGDTLSIYRFVTLSLHGSLFSPWENVISSSPGFVSDSSKPFPYTLSFWFVLMPFRLLTYLLGSKSEIYTPMGALGINALLLACFIHLGVLFNRLISSFTSKSYNTSLYLSPVLIYLVFFQRQIDIIVIYVTFLSFYFAVQEKWRRSFLFLGLAASLKLYPFALFPIMGIWLLRKSYNEGRDGKGVIKDLFWFLFSILSSLILIFGNFNSSTYRLGLGAGEQLRWSQFVIKIGEYQTVHLFLLPVIIALFLSLKSDLSIKNLALIWSLILMNFPLFTTPQMPWWSWGIPYVTFLVILSSNRLERYIILFAELSLFFYTFYYQYSTLVQLFSWKMWGFPLKNPPINDLALRVGSLPAELFGTLLYSVFWLIFFLYLAGATLKTLLERTPNQK
jgi:hypothetical protein